MREKELSQEIAAGILHELENDRVLVERLSTAEKVAEVLGSKIMEGQFRPGSRLPEEIIASTLAVSRNTVREAFRLLSHERLASHEPNRGMFVSKPSIEDLKDIYDVRRLVEGNAVRRVMGPGSPPALTAIATSIDEGMAAAEAGDWQKVGTADLSFHRALVSLLGSQRMDDLMRKVLSELRLVFHVMDHPERFHSPYLARNEEIYRHLETLDGIGAEKKLLEYLADSERQLLSAYQESGSS